MDAFSAVICGAQALGYALSAVKSLAELRTALKYGRDFLRDEQANVVHLQEIVVQLIPKDQTRRDRGLDPLLQSISTTLDSLLALFKQQKRRQLVSLLVVRRAEVNESFALLERKKNTLILYLTARNSATIDSFKTGVLSQSTELPEMPRHPKPYYVDPDYETMGSSMYPPGQFPHKHNSLALAQQASLRRTTIARESWDLEPPVRLPEHHRPSHTTTTSFSTKGNKASGRGQQIIFAPAYQGVDVRHKKNSVEGDGIQRIGLPNTDPSVSHEEDVVGIANLTFSTRFNHVKQRAVQRIFAPSRGTNSTHDGNVADCYADQILGLNPTSEIPAAIYPEAIPSPSPPPPPMPERKRLGGHSTPTFLKRRKGKRSER